MNGDRLIRLATAAVVTAVAAFAAVVSYSHVFDLGRTHGQSGVAARLLPLSVDGLLLAASLVLLHEARNNRTAPRLARLMLWLGIAATLGANVAYGVPYGALGALVSAWPAVSLVGAVELLMGLVRRARPAGLAASGNALAETIAGQCGHRVAGSADEAVVQAFLHGRDCLGSQPSQRQLAASFGVSRAKVAALVASPNGKHPQDAGETPPGE
jgi:Protein of unknown function (DUF2637)